MSSSHFLMAAMFVVGCGRSVDVNARGSHGGACYPNGTCDLGLVCAGASLCVDAASRVCERVVCSDHGACVAADGVPACVCDADYTAVGLSCVQFPGCTPTARAFSLCDGGDVYWFDGCGGRQERRHSCGGAGCNGASCTGDTTAMTRIDDYPGGPFWIDVYEASTMAAGAWGSWDQDADDDGKLADLGVVAAHALSHGFVWDDDGGEEAVVLTTKAARTAAGVLPITGVSYYQAAAACANAGKRLCSGGEWLWVCQGGGALTIFPYGDTYDGGDAALTDCWSNFLSPTGPQLTGTAAACVSPTGVADLSGNVAEYTDLRDPLEADARGGDYGEADTNVSCGRVDSVEPVDYFDWIGLRCCRDP